MRKCRICLGEDFKTVIDFGDNPLVNSLVEKEDLDKTEPVFPLVVEQCQSCSLVQVVNPIDSNKIYRDVDYLYFSGDMPGLSDYFKEYVDDNVYKFTKPGDFIVEIGSNDGTMLKHFKDLFFDVLGVDPATNVVVRALKNKIPTISDSFNERVARSIVREFGKAKMVYGNNCIAHIDDLHSVMKGVKELLTDDGIFIVECNYWGSMVKNKNYALIYHDHFSYFTIKNWIDMAGKYGLEPFDAVITPAQGGSLRIFMGKGKEKTQELLDLIKEEEETNLASYATCQKYEKEVREEAAKLWDLVTCIGAGSDGEGNLTHRMMRISGYGAAAKGFSVLKLAEIDQRHLDYFVDDSPAKQGKYTPITHIPVISRKEAETKLPDYFLITAPNYERAILDKEQEFLHNGGRFITIDGRILCQEPTTNSTMS